MSESKTSTIIAYEKGYRVIDGAVISPRGKSLKLYPGAGKYAYYRFTIHDGVIFRHVAVHQLAAFQKYGEKVFDPDIVVRHLDGDRFNNKEYNISVGSPSENAMDRPKSERISHSKRAASFMKKYDDDIILDIRKFHNEHGSYKKTMEAFGITSKGQLHYLLHKQV